MGAPDKINAISLNVNINKLKSAHIRGYKLPINVQNFYAKRLSPSENIVESRKGATFLTHPVHLGPIGKILIDFLFSSFILLFSVYFRAVTV